MGDDINLAESSRLRKLAEHLLFFAEHVSSAEEAVRLRRRAAEVTAEADKLAGEQSESDDHA